VIRVRRAGLLTTVQDLGRRGMQQHGVSRGGAMDAIAHRITNLLVGNAETAAALECTLLGPSLDLMEESVVALGGGDLGATLDGRAVPLWSPFIVPAGSVLSFSGPRTGCRACIAVAGGIDVPPVLGSRGTDLIASIGGHEGRALVAGDELPTGAPGGAAAARLRHRLLAAPDHAPRAGRSLIPQYSAAPVVRIIRGPEHDRFSAASRQLLVAGEFEVTPQSNRMGLRLTGPSLSLSGLYDLHSSPVTMGTVQVPPSGDPIVLMADHQTIGGYPRIASVISVDLPLLAQAAPGARVRFREVSLADAQTLYLRREHDLRLFATGLHVLHTA
jgi:antagonist of KipI